MQPTSFYLLFLNMGPFEILMVFGVLAILITPAIFYLITIQNTFKEISVENRRMKPGQVWLSLIPVFGLAWQFVIVDRMTNSLIAEFLDRDFVITEDRPGYKIGMAYAILFCLSFVPIPIISFFIGIAGFVLWIMYWVKINDYRTKLRGY